ncbi:MAG: phosphopantetheine adenylyltransferase, partial [Pseudomonadota bacterium]
QETAARIKIVTFDDLAIEAAQRAGATMFIRGLRDGTDLDYEAQLAGMNAAMAPGVETIFLPASASVRHIAANLVRQIALMGGNVAHFVAPVVEAALIAKRGS